jgi:hypothetical protein
MTPSDSSWMPLKKATMTTIVGSPRKRHAADLQVEVDDCGDERERREHDPQERDQLKLVAREPNEAVVADRQ